MKKTFLILIAILLAFSLLGLAACNAKSTDSSQSGGDDVGESITQDAFIAELERREAASFASSDRYDTVTWTYKENGRSYSGTSELEYGIKHGYMAAIANVYAEGKVDCDVPVLGVSQDSIRDVLPTVEWDQLTFTKKGTSLEAYGEGKTDGESVVFAMTFDKDGYLTYSLTQDEEFKVEFTATAYSKKGSGGNHSEIDNDHESMTKEAFLAELERREAATFADNDKRYAAVEVELVLQEGDSDDGTYRETCNLTYGINQYDEPHAYVSVKKGSAEEHSNQQQLVLGQSYHLRNTFEAIPTEALPGVRLCEDEGSLVFELNAEYRGAHIYGLYVFDADGYLTYRSEGTEMEGYSESITFTAFVYHKTAEMTQEEFLRKLRSAESYSYTQTEERYANVTGTLTLSGSDEDGAYEGTFALTYDMDLSDNPHAAATIRLSESKTRALTVLGLSKTIEQTIAYAGEEVFTFTRNGSNYEAEADFTHEDAHIVARYVFDNDGYVLYYLLQQNALVQEFTATAYAPITADEGSDDKEPEDEEPSDPSIEEGSTYVTLAGNSFTIESIDEWEEYQIVETIFGDYIGSIVEFKADGTFTWTVPHFMGEADAIVFGEYTQDGATATYTQFELIQGDNDLKLPEEARPTHEITVSSDGIVMITWITGEIDEDTVYLHLNASLNE